MYAHYSGWMFEFERVENGYALVGIKKFNKKELKIPSQYRLEKVLAIGPNVFADCTYLTSVEFSDNVTTIYKGAFKGCTGLAIVKLGNSLSTIGQNAFYNCESLKKVYYSGSVEEWCKIGGLKNLLNDNCVFYINGSIVEGDIVLNSGTEYIASASFYRCNALTSITIPFSVVGIGDYAFYECTAMDSVTFIDGSDVRSFGEYAFYNCKRLTSIVVPSEVKSIGQNAFEGCEALTSIVYQGRKEKWNNISKGSDWDKDTGNYVIHCVNGDIAK